MYSSWSWDAKSNAQNTRFGTNALPNNTGTNNTAIGLSSMFSDTSGNSNTAIGHYSLQSNTIGYDNTAGGYQSLKFNTSGSGIQPMDRHPYILTQPVVPTLPMAINQCTPIRLAVLTPPTDLNPCIPTQLVNTTQALAMEL
jgi:hypothetical protein